MKLPEINMPTLAGMRTSFAEAKESISQYSVSLKLPTFSKKVSVSTVTEGSNLAAQASKTKTIFEGSAFKGFTIALGTLLIGAVALGGVAALVSNPIGLGVLALSVVLFALATTLKVSHTPPPPPVVEVVAEPIQLTNTQYIASLVGLGGLVGVKA